MAVNVGVDVLFVLRVLSEGGMKEEEVEEV